MRILIIHQYFLSPHSRAGSGSRWNQMAKFWSQAGHRVTVLAGASDGAGNKIDAYRGAFIFREKCPYGVDVYRCHVSESYNRSFVGRLWAYFSFLLSALWAGMRTGRQDIVIASSPPLFVGITGILLSWMKRCPHVFEIRDLWPESAIDTGVLKNPLAIRAGYGLERWIYDNSEWINALTPAFVEVLREKKDVPPSKLSMIPNACDLDLIPQADNSAEVRQELGLHREVLVTYVGAHGVANHLIQFLEAARRLKSRRGIRFLLVGNGMTKPTLVEQASQWQLNNLTFHDPVPKKEIFDYLRASDICVAVLKKVDTFKTVYPNKVFDYMSVSRPVVVGIDGQARALVEESGCGLYAEPENAKELASAIEKLASDPDLRRRMGLAGRVYAERHFDRCKLAAEYEGVLARLTGRWSVANTDRGKPRAISFQIGAIHDHEWRQVAEMIAAAIPNAIISRMGVRFGAMFYAAISSQDYSCIVGARDESGRLLAVIVGSLNKPGAYNESLSGRRMRLAVAANLHLVAPAVILWILRGLLTRSKEDYHADRPLAELIAITVRPECRGMGVAQALVGAMESFFSREGHTGSYAILTEASNTRANRFYAKIGSVLVVQTSHRGRKINEWRKSLGCRESS